MSNYRVHRTIVVGIFAVVVGWTLLEAIAGPAPKDDIETWIGPGIVIAVAIAAVPLIFRMLRPARIRRREFRDAPVGVGTLVAAVPTGMTINDQPELELTVDVETADGRTFRAATREIIDLGTLPQLVPGVVVPVAYLPDDRIALHEPSAVARLADVLYASRVRAGKMTQQQVEVARHGRKARAVVMALQPTGEVRGDEAVMLIDFRVTRPDGTTFDATREAPVPAIALPGLQPGSVVGVSYLPGDEGYVAFDMRVR